MMKKQLLIGLLFIIGLIGGVQAQQLDSADVQLLRAATSPVDHSYDARHVTYGFTPGKRTWNPVYHVLSSSMYVYQSVVSPIISRRCAFSPTCSAYSKALLHEYGLLKGTFLTADRLMRCNRISLSDKNNQYILVNEHGRIYESVDRYRQ